MSARRHQNSNTVVFLGAGASCADGAPLQKYLFRDYFQYYNDHQASQGHHQWDEELVVFFREFFGIDVRDRNVINTAMFPTFEEVLGIIEIADSQKESFRDWGTACVVSDQEQPRLQHMHDVLILLIAEILAHKLGNQATHHPRLVHSLHDSRWLPNTSFISLNYDILIDNALLRAKENYNLDLDYVIEFMNFGQEWKKPRLSRSLPLLKLHGSLNWLYCPTCRSIRITPKVKGVCRLKWQPNECLCSRCDTLAVPIIIPPTYFKALSNFYLRQIWHRTEKVLLDCNRLIFCGYSFPDADVHVRYLLKRIEVNGRCTPEVYIVNEHDDKSEVSRQLEKERYARFFRDKSKVHWTELSFEDFCGNPTLVEETTS